MTNDQLLKTPLCAAHQALGAKMVDFGGWLMPVQYTGIIQEHEAVRAGLGVFDISHMGQIFAEGAGSEAWLNRVLANNAAKLAPGQGQYTFMLNERGGVIDDLILYRLGAESWLLLVNAAKITEDFSWLESHRSGEVQLKNASDDFAGLAVQGPRATAWHAEFFGGAKAPGRNEIVEFDCGGRAFIARTGYTGEDGFELFVPAAQAEATLQRVIASGATPCGLGARDTLRLEMCYPLNGSDLSPDHTPLEAGLGFFVDLEKGDFIGRDALAAQKASGLARKLAAFRMTGTCPPPRAHYPVLKDGQRVGETTSGGLSPSLKSGIGLAYLPAALAKPGETIEIEIRGRAFPAVIEKKPLYKAAAHS